MSILDHCIPRRKKYRKFTFPIFLPPKHRLEGMNRHFEKSAKYSKFCIIKTTETIKTKFCTVITKSSAIAEGPREALVSRNPATTKHLT